MGVFPRILFASFALAFSCQALSLPSLYPEESPLALRNYEKERSDFLVPLGSMLLPGFGQWREGQTTYGTLYSGGGLAGVLYNLHFSHRVKKKYDADTEHLLPDRYDQHNKDSDIRNAQLGSQFYFTMGGLSTYHSFRSAVRTAKGDRYDFLSYEETPKDLALAPFYFSYLLRPTTYIPLMVGVGLLTSSLNASADNVAEAKLKRSYSLQDTAFSMPMAYNAGVGEEALFRGWLMPLMRADLGSGYDHLANALSALAFGLGHLSSNNRAPVFQTLAGYYLGYVSQKNDWRLGESIFIHAWWDFLTISASYAFSPLDKDRPSPIIWLPPLQLDF